MLDFLRKRFRSKNYGSSGGVQLISIHIPKTAGTSFRNTLKAVYGDEAVIRLDIPDIQQDAARFGINGERKRVRLNQENFEGNRLPTTMSVIHGHFNLIDLYTQFNISPKVPVITWLRDPVERVISNYYYFVERLTEQLDEKSIKILCKMQRTLMEYARDNQNRNRISLYLRGVPIEELTFVGIQEYYSEDLQVLAQHFQWPEVTEFKHNITPEKYMVSEADRAEIASLNELDIALYNQALERRGVVFYK